MKTEKVLKGVVDIAFTLWMISGVYFGFKMVFQQPTDVEMFGTLVGMVIGLGIIGSLWWVLGVVATKVGKFFDWIINANGSKSNGEPQ